MNIGSKNYQKGFTLLEMLLVIAIIAILAGIVIVAINPGRQLAQARNAQRASDLRAIHSAVNQYYIDNREWPADLETVTTLEEICDTGAETEGHGIDCTTDGLIDLSILVPTYISAIPTDPQGAITALIPFIKTAHAQTPGVGAGYEIAVNPATQMVILSAPKSTEYGLNTVALGDVESVTVPEPCGNPALTECWSDVATETMTWGPNPSTTNATSTADGAENTATILATAGTFPAAEYCDNLTEGGFTDWYLPAIDQLAAGLTAYGAGTVTGFADDTFYWSSTEYSSSSAWIADYGFDVSTGINGKGNAISVRCLR